MSANVTNGGDKPAQMLERALADLPPLPLAAARLLQALEDPQAAVTDLARLIALDQGLAAKALRLVNSSYYGFPRQVTTIRHAVVLLGVNTVRNLAIAVAAFDRFAPSRAITVIDHGAFWEHCIGVALGAQLIARRKRLPAKTVEEAFLAGLLHDIGKLFLCQHFPLLYEAALGEAWQARVPISVAERKHCGAAHTLIGKRIAERWNLPPVLVACIWRHHDPRPSADHFEITALVSAGDAIARTGGIGFAGDLLPAALEPHVLAWLALDARALQSIEEELREKVAEAREFLQVVVAQ